MTYVRNFIYLVLVISAVAVGRADSGAGTVAADVAGARNGTVAEPVSEPATRPDIVGSNIVARVDGALVYADSAEQVANVVWALGRYAEVGLELAFVEVHYFSDRRPCRSDDGRDRAGYLEFGDGKYTIYICGTVFTLLHELGHVWDLHSLDNSTRQRFLYLRNLGSWTHDSSWNKAGGEHLADVLAWGLQDGHIPPSRSLPNDSDSLYEAFVVATGRDPLS